jgi:hypothetical protein
MMSSSHVSFWGNSGIVDLYFDTVSQTAVASHFGTRSNLGVVDGSPPFGARYRTHGNSCMVLKSAFLFQQKGGITKVILSEWILKFYFICSIRPEKVKCVPVLFLSEIGAN